MHRVSPFTVQRDPRDLGHFVDVIGVQQRSEPTIVVRTGLVVPDHPWVLPTAVIDKDGRVATTQWLNEPMNAQLFTELGVFLDHPNDLTDVGLALGFVLNDDGQVSGPATKSVIDRPLTS
jgi:hypothetical protein